MADRSSPPSRGDIGVLNGHADREHRRLVGPLLPSTLGDNPVPEEATVPHYRSEPNYRWDAAAPQTPWFSKERVTSNYKPGRGYAAGDCGDVSCNLHGRYPDDVEAISGRIVRRLKYSGAPHAPRSVR